MRNRTLLALVLALLSSKLMADSFTTQSVRADIWWSSNYSYGSPTHTINDDKLQVGGWGDNYYTYIRFDLSATPPNASSAQIWLYCYPKSGASNTDMNIRRVDGPWNESGWSAQPASTQMNTFTFQGCNQWNKIDVTSLYNEWKNGTRPNYGIALTPTSTNNNFNLFYSSQYVTDQNLRPRLVVTYTPQGTPTETTYQPQPEDGVDMWYSNHFNTTSVNDSKLQVGGWGDTYASQLRFNLNCMPKVAQSAILKLYSYDRLDGSSNVPMNLYALASDWQEIGTSWSGFTYYISGTKNNLPAPTKGSWYSIDITLIYNSWQNGVYVNKGIRLEPTIPDNPNPQFNVFRSSDYSDPAFRPKLVVQYLRDSSEPFNLCFPLKQDGAGVYTTPIASVFDHNMTTPDCADNTVTAFTGEQGQATYGVSNWSFPASGCSGQLHGLAGTSLFSLNGQYKDTQSGRQYLYYDGHTGYDYEAAIGTPVYATASGSVVMVGGPFNTLKIVHDTGPYETYYLHLSAYLKPSGHVERGDLIALSGEKGVEGNPHLHLTIMKNGVRVDPYEWLGSYPDPYTTLNNGVQNILLWQQ
jgi:murein DD-endopeptidase MepM/ murein hydrolase activator NlpD